QALPVQLGGLGLIALGIGLFVLDLKLAGHAFLSVFGVIALVLGGLLLYQSGSTVRVHPLVLVVVIACVTVLFMVVARKVMAARRSRPVTGTDALIGVAGTAPTPPRRAGPCRRGRMASPHPWRWVRPRGRRGRGGGPGRPHPGGRAGRRPVRRPLPSAANARPARSAAPAGAPRVRPGLIRRRGRCRPRPGPCRRARSHQAARPQPARRLPPRGGCGGLRQGRSRGRRPGRCAPASCQGRTAPPGEGGNPGEPRAGRGLRCRSPPAPHGRSAALGPRPRVPGRPASAPRTMPAGRPGPPGGARPPPRSGRGVPARRSSAHTPPGGPASPPAPPRRPPARASARRAAPAPPP